MVPETLAERFTRTYGSAPAVMTSAPGRVNLIGEHTDYNGGQVLPIAISQRTYVAMSQIAGPPSVALSYTESGTGEFDPVRPLRSGQWWDYVSGLGGFADQRHPPVQLAVTSDVPAGAGLSSSAALEVATGLAYSVLTHRDKQMRDIALDAWRVETEFVGVSCGIMDQFASALSVEGHALHIWCDTTAVEHVPFSSAILIFDTAVPRSLRASQFNRRQAECAEALRLLQEANPGLPDLAHADPDEINAANLPPILRDRAVHVVNETRRVGRAVSDLRHSGKISADLLYESHESLRVLYQCSSPELDWFVDRAMRAAGVGGARLTGAGWGGCAIALGPRDALDATREEIVSDYEQAFGISPRAWLTEAAEGARVER